MGVTFVAVRTQIILKEVQRKYDIEKSVIPTVHNLSVIKAKEIGVVYKNLFYRFQYELAGVLAAQFQILTNMRTAFQIQVIHICIDRRLAWHDIFKKRPDLLYPNN